VCVVRPDYTETEVVAEEVRDDVAFRDAFGVRGEAEGRGSEEKEEGGEGVSRGGDGEGQTSGGSTHAGGYFEGAHAWCVCVCV
jgi:hypothetical protein